MKRTVVTASKYDLIGWKAIGEWLGVTPRAAQKWRREAGLPVVRIRGNARAASTELAAWMEEKARAA